MPLVHKNYVQKVGTFLPLKNGKFCLIIWVEKAVAGGLQRRCSNRPVGALTAVDLVATRGYRFDIRISPNVGYFGNYWSATSMDDHVAQSINPKLL
ncbi:MAG: hypothetical protein R2730_03440 [Chitinophagales bacterium]